MAVEFMLGCRFMGEHHLRDPLDTPVPHLMMNSDTTVVLAAFNIHMNGAEHSGV